MAKKPPKKRVISRLRPMYQRTFIRQWREHRKMSQEELAAKIGEYLAERGIKESYSYATLGRLERGLIPYKQQVMEAIADALGVTVEMLIAQPPPKEGGEPDPDMELRGLWRHADSAGRAAAVQVLRALQRKAN